SSNELAMLLRSAGDRDGRGNNRLSKIECKRGTRMSRFASRNRRLAYVVLPFAVLFALTVTVTASTFKKYL
ncbi:MAG: hypothetical protein RPU91_14000, partial [Candidatus Sedimenticola sp. (ex Thyasira tokunagai)]